MDRLVCLVLLVTLATASPVSFPDDGRSVRPATDGGGGSQAQRPPVWGTGRQPNSFYNRLTNNRAGESDVQAEEPEDYVDFEQTDKPVPSDATTAATPTNANVLQQPIISILGYPIIYNLNTRRPKRRRRPTCVPFRGRSNGDGGGGDEERAAAEKARTLGFNYYNYDVSLADPVASDSVQQTGGYGCLPFFNFALPAANFGPITADNAQNDVTRPQGGFLGFFGQGGLFDFSGLTNQIQSSVQSTLTQSLSGLFPRPTGQDSVKPVAEESLEPPVTNTQAWNAGELVGGIANQVTGFVQNIITRPFQPRPDGTMRQRNTERPLFTYF